MRVPIRHVDFDRLEREVRRAVDPVRGYRGDDLYAAPILRSPDRPSALTTLFNALGSALASRHRRVADVDWEQPLVRALARVSGHPELPSPRFVLLTVTAPMEDAAAALAARAAAAPLPWDVDAVKADLVAQLRTVFGDERVADSQTPTMKGWGASSATARALIILLALDELGRLRDAPPARSPATAPPRSSAAPAAAAAVTPRAAAVTPRAAPTVTTDSDDVETIDLAHPPRSGREAAFVLRVTPCASCGATDGDGVSVSGAGPIVLSVQCAGCRKRRRVRYATPLERGEPPPYHLARAAGPSRVIAVERFAATAARDLARTVDDPAAVADVAALDAGTRALVRARTALTELAKFLRGDEVPLDGESASAQAARAANPERFTRAWIEAQLAVAEARTPRYVAARDVVQRERGAARGAGLAERGRAHARWLKAGRSGPGRLEMIGERWEGSRFGTPDLTAAVLRNTNLARTTFQHATLHEAEIEQTSFSRASLVGVGLQRATLREVDATEASLALGRLEGARIEGGTWRRADLRRASLARARLVGVDLRGGNLAETVLDGATLERCDLRDVDLRHEAQWKRLGTARQTTFVECDLRGARVDAWRLDGAVFERCRMHGITGVPEVEGALTVVDADLSVDGDGSVRGGVDALAGWRR